MEFQFDYSAIKPQPPERTVNFDKMADGLVPAVVQDHHTAVVLMLGYMNAEAYAKTLETGYVTFFSRSKQRLWMKGESSGHVLRVRSLRIDCDGDAILLKAEPAGPVCHTGDDTCWGESNNSACFLKVLEHIIGDRKEARPEGSYTVQLFDAGIAKIAQKVGEEAVETVIEALGDNRERMLDESADLLYHLLVLLAAKNIRLEEVENILKNRHVK